MTAGLREETFINPVQDARASWTGLMNVSSLNPAFQLFILSAFRRG
jgi:hypothetical protein